ncbi:hypothetical protein J6590_075009 [Homalodisca vitripennis]|nr:hypothetical protein J6590_075009 [Homalodisca vitripennis]
MKQQLKFGDFQPNETDLFVKVVEGGRSVNNRCVCQHVFSPVRHCCHWQRRYAMAVAGCSPAFYRRRSAVGVCARFRSLIQFTIGIWTAGKKSVVQSRMSYSLATMNNWE